MTTTEELVARFDSIIEDLRIKTRASRTTLRMDSERHGFFVNSVVSESLESGIKSIRHEVSLQQRRTDTYQLMERTRDLLVQNDCANADPPAPQPLMDVYGVKSQMLAPILKDDQVIGWISVHYNPDIRIWSEDDIAALREAQRLVTDEIATL